MKNFILFGFFGLTLIAGCVQTPEPDIPKRVNISYNIENLGSNIVLDQDTIAINEVKLLADRINLILVDETILQTTPDALVMTYRSEFEGADETIVSASIGFEDLDHFQGMNLFIDIPMEGDNIQDNDFFGDQNNFSFIFRGSYNGRDFTYKSGPNFEKNFSFDSNIELTNTNETLLLRFTYDIEDIVVDREENRILDPDNSENSAKIDSLVQEFIAVEASAVNIL